MKNLSLSWRDTVEFMSKSYDVFENKLPDEDSSKPKMVVFKENSITDLEPETNLVNMVDHACRDYYIWINHSSW